MNGDGDDAVVVLLVFPSPTQSHSLCVPVCMVVVVRVEGVELDRTDLVVRSADEVAYLTLMM